MEKKDLIKLILKVISWNEKGLQYRHKYCKAAGKYRKYINLDGKYGMDAVNIFATKILLSRLPTVEWNVVVFSKRYTHSNNKLSIKVENKRGRGSRTEGGGEVRRRRGDGDDGGGGLWGRLIGARLTGAVTARGCILRRCSPAHPRPSNFDMRSWHIIITTVTGQIQKYLSYVLKGMFPNNFLKWKSNGKTAYMDFLIYRQKYANLH